MSNKGSYLWNFEVITHWNDEKENDDDGMEEFYTVSSPTFEGARKKVETLALSKSRKFVDTRIGDDGVEGRFTFFPVSLEIIKVERGDWFDG